MSNIRTTGRSSVASLVVTVVAAGLVVSCSDASTPGGTDSPSSRSSAPAPPPTSPPPTSPAPSSPSPTGPSARSANGPAALAQQLDDALATLSDPQAAAADVQRAAEFEQLGVRGLAQESTRFQRRTIDRLRPAHATIVRSQVRAAGLLSAMTSPQPKLPRWRIVAPPPAPELEHLYREAERRSGVPWHYLAAIHLVETRMGRIRGTSTAGARGPMQFLPSTWARYGAGGDIEDPADAILAAARLLRANGAPGDMATALWHYNPSRNYVQAVTAYAETVRRAPWSYRGYWHWQVLYKHKRGSYVLPVGYPRNPAVLLPEGWPAYD
jgi:membrane-bound lytic murein transglycosylase B